ncbi:MAG: MFS transporter [Chloroflexi bacterium]|nr:MFS transporter [Chloroflexota bacterium]
MAVATLSVFAVPMTREFGWSYGLFSGVVSLGGLCAIGVSPFVGRLIDRYGSGAILALTSVVVGCCAIGLSLVSQAWAFYALYVPGRMAFASPLELGTTTAINNWFIRRRPLALFLLTVSQSTGLAAMPLVADFLIGGWGWRNAWAWLGIFTLVVGILPALLLVSRRPEDMGLTADPRRGEARLQQSQQESTPSAPEDAQPGDVGEGSPGSSGKPSIATSTTPLPERNYTVSRALHTRAFYVMAIFSGAGFMVQAGVSLHQVSHFINQGLEPSMAALTAASFAFCQMLGGLVWSALASRRVPIRILLAASAFFVSGGALGVQASSTLTWGLPAASVLGAGVGGLHLLLRLAWAEYYGREHLGSITGITLPVQVGGQALGPIIAGFLYDFTGSYLWPFRIFSTAVFIAGILVLTATPPRDRS